VLAAHVCGGLREVPERTSLAVNRAEVKIGGVGQAQPITFIRPPIHPAIHPWTDDKPPLPWYTAERVPLSAISQGGGYRGRWDCLYCQSNELETNDDKGFSLIRM
jgi:hypothetical protein